MMNRYHRQELLEQIGPAGQARLWRSRVLLVGCGALGTVLAEQLARAGVGHLRICDRDVVELTNLQRQTLFTEADAAEGAPKAIAAARRLGEINSSIEIDPRIVDVDSSNIESLAGCTSDGEAQMDLLLDGTDNAEIRYLINDVAVRHGIPWVYGACIATEGRVMPIRPGVTPCLRCLFPNPPAAGELPTCDTVGVLGPVASAVASIEAVEAIKLLVGAAESMPSILTTLDLWRNHLRTIPLADARRADCPTCGERRFEFLDRPATGAISLCGRDTIQIRPAPSGGMVDLASLEKRLKAVGTVQRTPYLLRLKVHNGSCSLTVFPDGRAMFHGLRDPAAARSAYARYIGG